MKTLIEIHVLQNFAPSNLNRDDTGAPKDAFFGGRRRARISSQCIKRAVREYFKRQNGNWFASRTKRLVDDLKTKLEKKLASTKGYSDENLIKAIEAAINCIGIGDKKVKVEKDKKTGQMKTDVLLFLSTKEIDALASVVEKSYKELLKDKIPSEVSDKVADSLAGKENKSRLTLDIALFGRMLAVMPEKNQNAACQVAHAISTHAVEREFDFYTAVDDLKPEDIAGADMMGTVEFNSACFYRYAVVDYKKLVDNLPNDNELALTGLRAFLEGFVVAEPAGKQNTFAAHNPPEFVLVSVRKDGFPRNLANAFEVPVRVKGEESLTRKSVKMLADKAKELSSVYGDEGKSFCIDLIDSGAEIGTKKSSLQELLNEVIAEVRREG
ncbi:MAG: type I-E CRISPR-associated protein Cas7/Cse4/CasC [Candidatus Aureabacteria bacterium]|nr:type I-E CRISPR-associated protein Cas7/Cse4/CasC [Candidatus Auribacterota bacterium]